jgi:hypothetical protein
MSEAEAREFLELERTLVCATMGARGWPHLMPLWYVLHAGGEGEPDPQLWAWTYAVSQKVRNLERDPRATVEVEAGEEYSQLRGVMIEAEVVIYRDFADVAALGREIFARCGVPPGQPPLAELPDEVTAMVDQQAAKRVGLQFVERRRATWDHRKLAGIY